MFGVRMRKRRNPRPRIPSAYTWRMAKEKSIYVCGECGGTSAKWLGKCPGCGAWNTLVEQSASAAAGGGNNNRFGNTAQFASLAGASELMLLSEIEAVDVARTIQTTPVDMVEMTYRVQYRVQDVDDNLKAVDVRVTWDEPKRPGRTLTLTSQLHDDPPTGG